MKGPLRHQGQRIIDKMQSDDTESGCQTLCLSGLVAAMAKHPDVHVVNKKFI
jgi:hypothetical protein